VKERPILFQGAMVRALLAGTKTQTRRAIRLQPHDVVMVPSGNHLFDYRIDLSDYSRVVPMDKAVTLSPYGVPGDRLWVRENGWQRPERTPKMMREGADTWEPYYFDADGISEQEAADFKAWGFKRRPSIHMPRAHSRILLEVTQVRAERLQSISTADAIAEGCPGGHGAIPGYNYSATPVEQYRRLWDGINGAGSWDSNPWVWVVEFRKVAPLSRVTTLTHGKEDREESAGHLHGEDMNEGGS
jgi:hypothetical protein